MKKMIFLFLLFAGQNFLFAGVSDFFSQKGMEADLFCTRVRAKIAYSWGKSLEYFHLMFAAVGDDAKYGERDLGTRAKLKAGEVTDHAMESGKKILNDEKEKIVRKSEEYSAEAKKQFQRQSENLRRQGADLSEKAQKQYQEQKENLRKKTEDFRK